MQQGFFTKKETESKSRPGGKTYSCVSCGLAKECKNPKLMYQGGFKKKILNIGTIPSKADDKTGKVFRGKPYKLLQQVYAEMDIDLYDDCANMYAASCYSDENPTKYQIECCRRFVMKAIEELQPEIVVVLGDSPLLSVIGGRWKKDFGSILKWRGWTIPDQELGCWVLPTFSPENIMKFDNPAYRVKWEQDLSKIEGLLEKEFPVYEEPEIIYLKDDLSALDDIKSGKIAFDYETTGLKPHAKGHRIVCASVAVNKNKVYTFMIPKKRKQVKPFIDLLQRGAVKKIAQNMKFEDTWTNVRLKTEVNNWLWDTMIATHIIDNRKGVTSLKFQSYVQFGIIDYDSEIAPYLKTPGEHANEINRVQELIETKAGQKALLKYCAYDSVYELRLANLQRKHIANTQGKTELSPIKSDFPNAYHLLHNGILALAKAERAGIRIDTEYCEQQKIKLTKKINVLEKKFNKTKFYRHWAHIYGKKLNLNSDDQLRHLLYGIKKLTPPALTDSGLGSVSEESLKMLNIPDLNFLAKRSKYLKVRDTYLEGLVKESVDGFMHPFFNLHLARTYRSSSQNPNFQNQPKRDKEMMKLVRQAIFPREGHQLLEMDYSAIEVAIAACYHKDPTMIKYLEEGFDLHGDMAKQIFKIDDLDKHKSDHAYLRNAVKNGFVFPQFYGDYFKSNAEDLCGNWLELPQSKWKPGMGVEFEGGNLAEHLISNGIKEYGEIKYNKKTGRKEYTGLLKHIKDIEEDFWGRRFPVYARWKEKHFDQYLKDGYVSFFTGFVTQDLMRKNNAINDPIQGAAFHCLLWAFSKINEELEGRGLQSRLIGQIHDAIVFDIYPPELEEVYELAQNIGTKQLPEHFDWINVPLRIEAELCPVDGSWAEKEDWAPEIKKKKKKKRKKLNKVYYYYDGVHTLASSFKKDDEDFPARFGWKLVSKERAEKLAKELGLYITPDGTIEDDLPF
jgi:uracil-DNA glycosylase family 4